MSPNNQRIREEILESFRLFADPKMTESTDPVSRIIFGAEGPRVDPPSFEFNGFGIGPQGEVFSHVGSVDLSDIFGTDWDDDEAVMEQKFAKACLAVTEALKEVAGSPEFAKIPKTAFVIFGLSIADQFQKALCRISSQGQFELPPAKKA